MPLSMSAIAWPATLQQLQSRAIAEKPPPLFNPWDVALDRPPIANLSSLSKPSLFAPPPPRTEHKYSVLVPGPLLPGGALLVVQSPVCRFVESIRGQLTAYACFHYFVNGRVCQRNCQISAACRLSLANPPILVCAYLRRFDSVGLALCLGSTVSTSNHAQGEPIRGTGDLSNSLKTDNWSLPALVANHLLLLTGQACRLFPVQ